MKSIIAFILFLQISVQIYSQNFLDPTFSDDGKHYISFGGYTSGVDIGIQSTGTIVALSYRESGIAGSVLTALNDDGTTNMNFGTSGVADLIVPGGSIGYGTNLVVMSDDRIVVGFSTYNENFQAYYGVARFLANGQIDTTFGDEGYVLTGVDIDGFLGGIYGVAVQPDNKIVSYGTTSDPFNAAIVMFRLNEDGSLDTMFGDGEYEYQQFTNVGDYCVNMKFHDDHIYLIGHAMIPTGGPLDPAYADVAIAKLNMDGSPDLSFGVQGVYTNNFSDMGDEFVDILFLTDNSILALGYIGEEELTVEDGISDFLLCKISPEGALDTSFGTDGIQLYDYGLSHDSGVSIFMDQDEKIVLAGRTTPYNGYSDFGFFGILSTGEPNIEFGVDGKISIDLFSSLDDMLAAIPTPDGKILAAGTSNYNGNVVHSLARICPQGEVLPGLNEVNTKPNLLFPNPSQTIVYLTNVNSGTYRITDYHGRNVQSGNIEQGSIPVQQLNSGMYTLQILDSRGTSYISSFIKN